MDSKNAKKFDLHRLLLNLTDKINLKRRGKYAVLSNLSIYYTTNLKYQLQHGMKNLN